MHPRGGIQRPPPRTDPVQRRAHLALLWTVRDLRWSIVRGRPITLPNLLRLLSRRLHQLDVPGPAEPQYERLRQFYITQQPFRRRPVWSRSGRLIEC